MANAEAPSSVAQQVMWEQRQAAYRKVTEWQYSDAAQGLTNEEFDAQYQERMKVVWLFGSLS